MKGKYIEKVYTSRLLVMMLGFLLGFMLLVMMVSVLAHFVSSNSSSGGLDFTHVDVVV